MEKWYMKNKDGHCEKRKRRSNTVNSTRLPRPLRGLAMTALLLVSSLSHAGELQQFEKALKKEAKTEKVDTKKSVDEETKGKSELGNVKDSLVPGMVQTLLGIFLAGAFEMADEDDLGYVYRHLKQVESPALPTFRLEGEYQYLAGNDHAVGGRVEVGYLMIGAEGEFKRFWESSPQDELNVASGHVLLRALFSEVFQINLAIGEKVIWGDARHDGFEVGFPFYIIFGKHFLWDVRPYLAFIGGNDVYDISTGISYKYKIIGVRGGYRALSVEDLTLHGPEVNLFLQW